MVSKKLLKEYEFSNIEEYFDMVLESRINGQFKQAVNQFKKMSTSQKLDFVEYVRNNSPADYDFFMRNFE